MNDQNDNILSRYLENDGSMDHLILYKNQNYCRIKGGYVVDTGEFLFEVKNLNFKVKYSNFSLDFINNKEEFNSI